MQLEPQATPPSVLRRFEDSLLVVALLASAALPLIDVVGRPLGGFHVPGGAAYLQLLTLWLAFLGGLVATREKEHLTLSTAELLGSTKLRDAAALAEMAHTLKGASGNLGATRMQQLCGELQTLGRANELAQVGDRLTRLAVEFTLVSAALLQEQDRPTSERSLRRAS